MVDPLTTDCGISSSQILTLINSWDPLLGLQLPWGCHSSSPQIQASKATKPPVRQEGDTMEVFIVGRLIREMTKASNKLLLHV